MISAVIEFGERRLHEINGSAHGHDRAAGHRQHGRGHRHVRSRRSQAGIPVYKETIDEIVGILLAKDLLPS